MIVRKDTTEFAEMGVKVTETVVWSRGKSKAFSNEELARGDADSWVERVTQEDVTRAAQ